MHPVSGIVYPPVLLLPRHCLFSEGISSTFMPTLVPLHRPSNLWPLAVPCRPPNAFPAQRLRLAYSCIFALVLLHTGACANPALLTYLLTLHCTYPVLHDSKYLLDIDGLAWLYDTEITAFFDGLVPVATVTCRRRPSGPWFDDECAGAKREVRADWSEPRDEMIRPSMVLPLLSGMLRVVATGLLRRKREEFWQTKIDAESSTPCQLWKSIDALMGHGSASKPLTIGPTDFHQFFDAKVAGVRASTADARRRRSRRSTPDAVSLNLRCWLSRTWPMLFVLCRTSSARVIRLQHVTWRRQSMFWRRSAPSCSTGRWPPDRFLRRSRRHTSHRFWRRSAWILPMSARTGQYPICRWCRSCWSVWSRSSWWATWWRPACFRVGLPCSSLDGNRSSEGHDWHPAGARYR